MAKYSWAKQHRKTGDAQAVGEELERIKEEYEGHLKPSYIVDESRPDDATLHPYFEWDDEEAAERYREQQAGQLVRSVRVITSNVKTGEDEHIRAYYSIPANKEEQREQAYYNLDDVKRNQNLRAQVLKQAIADALAYKARYMELSDVLTNVFKEIDAIVETALAA